MMTVTLLCLLVLAVCIYFMWTLGCFQRINVEVCIPDIGRLVIAYKYFPTPGYSVENWFRNDLKCLTKNYCKVIAIHYNDTRRFKGTPRSYASGVILREDGNLPDQYLISMLSRYGYGVTVFPVMTNTLMATCMCKTRYSKQLALSRLYPKLSTYVELQKLCAYPFILII